MSLYWYPLYECLTIKPPHNRDTHFGPNYFAANVLSDKSDDSEDNIAIATAVTLIIRTMVYFLILVGVMCLPEN